MRGAVGFTGLVFTEFYMHYIGDMYAEMVQFQDVNLTTNINVNTQQ